ASVSGALFLWRENKGARKRVQWFRSSGVPSSAARFITAAHFVGGPKLMARLAIHFTSLVFSALVACPALAQSSAPLQTPLAGGAAVTDPEEIRACLCAHESVMTLGAQVDVETKRHQAAQDRIAALDQQLTQ